MSNGFISAGKTNSGVDRLHERSQKGAVSTEEKEVALELREATSVIRTLISQAINEGEAALDQNYPTLSGGRWTLWHNKEAHFLQAIKDIRLKPAVSIKISRAKLAPHPSFPAASCINLTGNKGIAFDFVWAHSDRELKILVAVFVISALVLLLMFFYSRT